MTPLKKVACQKSVPLRKILVLFALYLLSTWSTTLAAQQKTNSFVQSTSLMGQLFGPEAAGVHINQNLEKRFSLNVGIGFGLDAHLGFNVYLNNRDIKRFTWFTGLQAYLIHEVSFDSINIFGDSGSSGSDKRDSQAGLYLPIGFEYIAKNGFTIQLDLGPNFVQHDWGQTNTAPLMGSFKIGYTFRSKQK